MRIDYSMADMTDGERAVWAAEFVRSLSHNWGSDHRHYMAVNDATRVTMELRKIAAFADDKFDASYEAESIQALRTMSRGRIEEDGKEPSR